jgi:hypothetical protein
MKNIPFQLVVLDIALFRPFGHSAPNSSNLRQLDYPTYFRQVIITLGLADEYLSQALVYNHYSTQAPQ